VLLKCLLNIGVLDHRLLHLRQEENGGRLLAHHEKAGAKDNQELLEELLACELLP